MISRSTLAYTVAAILGFGTCLTFAADPLIAGPCFVLSVVCVERFLVSVGAPLVEVNHG